jgi:hypothetical protein
MTKAASTKSTVTLATGHTSDKPDLEATLPRAHPIHKKMSSYTFSPTTITNI